MSLEIKHDEQNHKFYVIVEGHEGHLKYSIKSDGKTLEYYSTYVPNELRGRQIASHLAEFALDYARKHHFKIIPTCSFVRWYIDHNPEQADLVA